MVPPRMLRGSSDVQRLLKRIDLALQMVHRMRRSFDLSTDRATMQFPDWPEVLHQLCPEQHIDVGTR